MKNVIFKIKETKYRDSMTLTLKDVQSLLRMFEKILPKVKQADLFICSRLYQLRYEIHPFTTEEVDMARAYVMGSLGAATTMEEWLRMKRRSDFWVHQTRILFLEQNIARFKKILKKHNCPF